MCATLCFIIVLFNISACGSVHLQIGFILKVLFLYANKHLGCFNLLLPRYSIKWEMDRSLGELSLVNRLVGKLIQSHIWSRQFGVSWVVHYPREAAFLDIIFNGICSQQLLTSTALMVFPIDLACRKVCGMLHFLKNCGLSNDSTFFNFLEVGPCLSFCCVLAI